MSDPCRLPAIPFSSRAVSLSLVSSQDCVQVSSFLTNSYLRLAISFLVSAFARLKVAVKLSRALCFLGASLGASHAACGVRPPAVGCLRRPPYPAAAVRRPYLGTRQTRHRRTTISSVEHRLQTRYRLRAYPQERSPLRRWCCPDAPSAPAPT